MRLLAIVVVAACGSSTPAPNEATPAAPLDATVVVTIDAAVAVTTDAALVDAAVHRNDAGFIIVPCTETDFDPKNPECKSVCSPKAPRGWPACKDICPDPPEVDHPACWHDRCDPKYPNSWPCKLYEEKQKRRQQAPSRSS
jgi:hypothetical protein